METTYQVLRQMEDALEQDLIAKKQTNVGKRMVEIFNLRKSICQDEEFLKKSDYAFRQP